MLSINLELKGRLILVVGAGRVGQRKLRKLLKAKALVRVVEPNPVEGIRSLAESGVVELFSHYNEYLLEGVDLVFVSSSQGELNRTVVSQARQRGLWVNVADVPEESDFTLPAMVEQGDFCLAVSTGGGSPALSAVGAEQLRSAYGPEYGLLARLLGLLRPLILDSGLEASQRESIFKGLAESRSLLELLAQGDTSAVVTLVAEMVAPVELGSSFHFGEELD